MWWIHAFNYQNRTEQNRTEQATHLFKSAQLFVYGHPVLLLRHFFSAGEWEERNGGKCWFMERLLVVLWCDGMHKTAEETSRMQMQGWLCSASYEEFESADLDWTMSGNIDGVGVMSLLTLLFLFFFSSLVIGIALALLTKLDDRSTEILGLFWTFRTMSWENIFEVKGGYKTVSTKSCSVCAERMLIFYADDFGHILLRTRWVEVYQVCYTYCSFVTLMISLLRFIMSWSNWILQQDITSFSYRSPQQIVSRTGPISLSEHEF